MTGPDALPVMTTTSVSPRWSGTGWTIFNNKGKPVRHYEPFFTDTHRFESDVKIGVSPTTFYDPTERVVATLHPNHTWQKVAFDSWRHELWDVNDTALVSDPKTDLDVGGFFRRLPDADYLPTWRQQRAGGALGPQEQAAALATDICAATPSVAHADSLGRAFLTVAHNRFRYSNGLPPSEEFYRSRSVFDVEGNPLEMREALGRVVIRYVYMLTGRMYQISMEAGERWMLNDVLGKAIRTWDSRGFTFRSEFDPLRRPLRSFVTGADPADPSRELMTERLDGEDHPAGGETLNLRGGLYLHFDQAGMVISERRDFKGNPVEHHAGSRPSTKPRSTGVRSKPPSRRSIKRLSTPLSCRCYCRRPIPTGRHTTR